MIRGVLLDVDGTLVLSNDAHAESWAKAFNKFGYDTSFEQVRKLIGMGGDKLVQAVNSSLNKDTGDGKKISDFRKKLFEEEYVAKLKPTPKSRLFVERLHQAGYKTVVASSASGQEIDNLLVAAEVKDLLPQATTSDDAENSKPDPDIVQAALDKIGLPAEEVILIGDTPYDIEAASKAGVKVIAVTCGGWSADELAEAIEVYEDLADILEKFDKSILAQSAKN